MISTIMGRIDSIHPQMMIEFFQSEDGIRDYKVTGVQTCALPIWFNSNFQWSTTSRDVRDGNTEHITREPEQVKAFRDTWRDGVHSYLTYLRDRLTVARDLLTATGSIFVQIGDENVHCVRAVMDEVFGAENFVSQIAFTTTSGAGSFAGSTNVIASIASH